MASWVSDRRSAGPGELPANNVEASGLRLSWGIICVGMGFLLCSCFEVSPAPGSKPFNHTPVSNFNKNLLVHQVGVWSVMSSLSGVNRNFLVCHISPGKVIHITLPHSCWLAWSYVGLLHEVTVAFSSCVPLPCWTWKTLFPLALTIFLTPLPWRSLTLRGRNVI